jgi:small Trp-rich protein
MYLLWIGVVCVLLKLLEIGPVGEWSWWWVLVPLAAAALWFEVFEKLLGFDRRATEPVEAERQRRHRIADQFRQLFRR